MKTSVALAALLIALPIALNAPAAALAQTPPSTARPASPSQTPRPGSGVTRDLNSMPPAAVAPTATTPAPAPTPTPAPTPAPAPSTTPRPTTPAPAATPAPTPAALVATAPAPVAAPAPRTAPVTSAPTPPVSAPTPAEPAPEPPVMTVLNPAAIAALPFTVELPAGFQITTGRPGPDFKIYTIRRGDQSFVTVYAGPASQFPIYTGETVQAGGRASIVIADQTGQRHALEHLFQRASAPREVHIWTSSLDGADQLLAERIAQSVDDR